MKRHPAAWELYLSQCIATGKKPATIQLYSDPLRRNATPHLKNLEIDVCDLHEKEATKLLCAQPDFIIVEINRGPSENDAKSVSASTFLH
jgi:hypothetical protein